MGKIGKFIATFIGLMIFFMMFVTPLIVAFGGTSPTIGKGLAVLALIIAYKSVKEGETNQ